MTPRKADIDHLQLQRMQRCCLLTRREWLLLLLRLVSAAKLSLLVQVCTFEDNRHQILRCAICDAVRGTSLEYFMGHHHAEVSSTAQHDVHETAATTTTGARSRRAGADAAGNKQKSILGFFAGGDAPARGTGADGLASSGHNSSAPHKQDGHTDSEQQDQPGGASLSPSATHPCICFHRCKKCMNIYI